MELGFML